MVPASQDSAIGLGGQNAIARRGSAAEMQSQAGPARPAMKSPPPFKLVSERSKYTMDTHRSLLGSALNNEQFGRRKGKKRYKEEENRPAWYNKDL